MVGVLTAATTQVLAGARITKRPQGFPSGAQFHSTKMTLRRYRIAVNTNLNKQIKAGQQVLNPLIHVIAA